MGNAKPVTLEALRADLEALEQRAAQLRRAADEIGSMADRILDDARSLRHRRDHLEALVREFEGAGD